MPCFSHDDKSLFFRQTGEGPLLLVLPGNTASSACHGSEFEHWGRRFHLASPDFLGTGRSPREDNWAKHWWRECADETASLISHLGRGPAAVMGVSGGGVAALLLAIHHGEMVRGVIADSCVETWTPEEIERLVRSRANLSLGEIAFWQSAHGDDWHDVVEADTAMIRSWAETGIDFYDGMLGRITCPVLLTASRADDLLPRVEQQIESMRSQIADCRAYLADEGSHPLMWSGAGDFQREADAFLERLSEDG